MAYNRTIGDNGIEFLIDLKDTQAAESMIRRDIKAFYQGKYSSACFKELQDGIRVCVNGRSIGVISIRNSMRRTARRDVDYVAASWASHDTEQYMQIWFNTFPQTEREKTRNDYALVHGL